MLSNTLPEGPLYDPKSKIKNFNEDYYAVRSEVHRTGFLFKDPNFESLGAGKEWRRVGEINVDCHFIKNQPDRFDALQGEGSDCWLMSAMEALTKHDGLFKHVVPPGQAYDRNYEHIIGAFHFRIWRLGTWYDVVVDDRLPVYRGTKNLCYAHSRSGDVFWACLLEKAYAKTCGCSYDNLWIEYATTGLQDLTGGIVESVSTMFPPSGLTTRWFIDHVYHRGALMLCSRYDPVGKTRSGLYANHSYSITDVFRCADDDPTYPGLYLQRILNPHGTGEWTGEWSDDSRRWRELDRDLRKKLNVKNEDDGEFWMEENVFVKYFDLIYVCHLGPGQYEESHRGEDVLNWKTTAFQGEWVKNISAWGSDLSTRQRNPQYLIELKLRDDEYNRDGYITVIIELTQRSKIAARRRYVFNIRFYVYSLNKDINLSKPLKSEFFINNKPLNDVDFKESADRSYVSRMNLVPGKYCIVPCTEHYKEEAQFLLRIWSECRAQMWEYDTKISKSMPSKEEHSSYTDDGLKRMFHDLADSQNEIDWVALKTILEKSVNTNQSYFTIFEPFYKFLWDFVDIFLPRSSNRRDTGEIVFSKDACRSMIAMLDEDRSGKLNFTEFSNLWNKLCVWTEVYNQHVGETEDCMKVSQLREALGSMGYNLNIQTIHVLIHLYADEDENITLVDFILCGVNLETGISLCQKMDPSKDKITFTLEEWVKNTLYL